MSKLDLPIPAGATVVVRVENSAGFDEVTYTQPGPVIAPPVAPDLSGTVSVNNQIVFDPINAPGASGEDLSIVALGTVTGGTAVINADDTITFTADGTAETVNFTYTMRAGTGVAPDGGEDQGTITVTKAAVAAGSGTVDLRVAGTSDPNSKLAVPEQLIAPAAYFFYAEASGFGVQEHFMDVRSKWDFDDPGVMTNIFEDDDSYPWDRVYDVDGTQFVVRGPKVYNYATGALHPTPAVKDALDGYRPNHGTARTLLGIDRNIAYGPRAVHVFNEPGTYVVTSETQKRGEAPVTETMTVTLLDPETIFTNYVVATDGNFSGAPAGQQFTSVNAAMAAIDSGSLGQFRRLLLKRGQSFSSSTVNVPNNIAGFQLGAWGSGAKPILRAPIRISQENGQCSIWGVDVRPSNYVASQPFNTANGKPTAAAIEKIGADCYLTMSDVRASGCASAFKSSGANKFYFFAQDFFCTDWHKYGFFLHQGCGMFGWKGLWFLQNNDAVMGGGEDETNYPFYVDHGPGRYASLGAPAVLSCSDMRVVGSRTATGLGNFMQPNLRAGRSNSGTGPFVEEFVVDRLRAALGRLSFGSDSTNSLARPKRYLYDKCMVIDVSRDGTTFAPRMTGMHFRNIVNIIGDAENARARYILERSAYSKSTTKDGPLIAEFGIALHNVTFVDLRVTPAQGELEYNLDALTQNFIGNGTAQDPRWLPPAYLRICNNVVHVPNRVSPVDTGDGPFDTSEVWRLDYPGARFETSTPVATEFAVPNGTGAYYELAAGSPAIGGASLTDKTIPEADAGAIAVDDFWGNLRGATTSRGAFD